MRLRSVLALILAGGLLGACTTSSDGKNQPRRFGGFYAGGTAGGGLGSDAAGRPITAGQ